MHQLHVDILRANFFIYWASTSYFLFIFFPELTEIIVERRCMYEAKKKKRLVVSFYYLFLVTNM